MSRRNALNRYGSHKKNPRKFTGLFFRNPVLVGGLLLAPAVVAAFSLKNALALSLTLAVVTLPTLAVASVVRKSVQPWLRIPLYSLLAAALLVPAYFVVAPIAPTIFDSIGMYFSLMAMNSVLYIRAEKFAVHNTIGAAVFDGLSYCCGFAVAALLIGGIRELLAYNTLWGISVSFPFKMSGAELPFMGFLLVGMLAAIGRYFRTALVRVSQKTTQFQLKRRVQLTLPSVAPRRDELAAGHPEDAEKGGEPV